MDNEMLSYYNRELNYLRKSGADFAEQHPKIAGSLRLNEGGIEDPHVSRLVESFAFLSARVKYRLDDSFPELTESLLSVLYPHLRSIIPSFMVVQFNALKDMPKLHQLNKKTKFFIDTDDNGHCYYTLAEQVDVLPLTVEQIKFSNYPCKVPEISADKKRSLKSVLSFSVNTLEGADLSTNSLNSLRFFINSYNQCAFKFYDFLFGDLLAVSLHSHETGELIELDKSAIIQSGLDTISNVLTNRDKSSNSHLLLAEYFCYPEKHLFFELTGLLDHWASLANGFDCYFYFKNTDIELIEGMVDGALLLSCAPLVNVFESQLDSFEYQYAAEPKRLTVPAVDSFLADIVNIQSVTAIDAAGNKMDVKPFYGSNKLESSRFYWHSTIENGTKLHQQRSVGIDTLLSIVDRENQYDVDENAWVISVDAICNNRDLPNSLPFGPDELNIQFVEGGAGIRIKSITPASHTVLPNQSHSNHWQLISQLSVQSFSGENALNNLRRVLHLHDFKKSAANKAIIEGISKLETHVVNRRIKSQGRSCLCRGTLVSLTIDKSCYSGSGLYLLGSIMNRFLADMVVMNSFIQLELCLEGGEEPIFTWEPIVGGQQLI